MPMVTHIAEIRGDTHSWVRKLSVSKNAVAPGIISRATIKIMPTACMATTTVIARQESSSAESRLVDRPIVEACAGSNANLSLIHI